MPDSLTGKEGEEGGGAREESQIDREIVVKTEFKKDRSKGKGEEWESREAASCLSSSREKSQTW